MSIDTTRPELACEILPEGVAAARRQQDSDAFAAIAYVPVNGGGVLPAMRSALDQVSERSRIVTLVLPDAAVRVLILDFDRLPTKVSEILPLIRFRLRKVVPFDPDDAAVSYQVLPSRTAARVLVVTLPNETLREREALVRQAGYEPGVVLPSTLAALACFADDAPHMLVNANEGSITTAISRGEEIMLHRVQDLPPREDGTDLWQEEAVQALAVAAAFYEDALGTRPDPVHFAGTLDVTELTALLGEDAFHLREAVGLEDMGTASRGSVPRSVFAGVRGALRG